MSIHFRNAAIGTLLLQRVEQTLFRQYNELKLESFEPNEIAKRFYRKGGWLVADQYFDADSGVNKIVMKKSRFGEES